MAMPPSPAAAHFGSVGHNRRQAYKMKYTAIPVAVLAGVAVCSGLKDDYTVTIPESVASWDTDAVSGPALRRPTLQLSELGCAV